MSFKDNWEKTDQNISLSTNTIKKMVKISYPRQELISHEVISEGCANINIKIYIESNKSPLILRIYLRDKQAAYREQKIGLLLKKTISTPQIYYIGNYENYCFAIVEFIPGISLRKLILENDIDISTIMHETGVILAKINSYGFDEAGFFDKNLNVIDKIDQKSYLAFAIECLQDKNVLNHLELDTIVKINFHLTKYSYFFPNEKPAQLVHADFDPSNILVDKVNGKWKVTGVLDWEFSFSGSILCDIANMLRYSHQVSPIFEKSFLQGLKDSGIYLPSGWRISVHMLNLISLLDCLTRSNSKNRPSQCADICSLLKYIVKQLDLDKTKKIDKTIKVVPYNDIWPHTFNNEANIIQQSLGNNCIEVHHIGSTSVPGLDAKPYLDILCIVHDLLDGCSSLQNSGYEFKGEYNIPLRYCFFKKLPESINKLSKVNLHLVEAEHGFSALNLHFRNHLRSNKGDCLEYASLKKELLREPKAHQKNNSMFRGYNLGKDKFIKNILKKTNFPGLNVNFCVHHNEWDEYHRILEEQIFKPKNITYDKEYHSLKSASYFHFVLYKGSIIVAVAQLKLLNDTEALLKLTATDEPYKNNDYENYLTTFIEKWLENKGLHLGL